LNILKKTKIMKKIILMSVFALVTIPSLAQSVSINPNNLQIPSVSALPACAAADYGKIVFLTSTNRANVCSGSGWVEVSAGGGGGGSLTLPYTSTGAFTTQGFQIINTGGGANSAALQGTAMSALTNAAGVWGSANETNPSGFNMGIRGSNFSTNNNGYGVYGSHAGGGFGTYGLSVTGSGVWGGATGVGGIGVTGSSSQSSAIGVYGLVTGSSANGVWGKSTNSTSVGGFFENSAVNGLALLTNGKLRFQGNGAAANKVLVSQDANGNANWEALTRTEILKLGPAAFYSHISSNESTMGSQGISMTSAAGSFHANVSLPNGATITLVRIYYIDNDGVAPATGLGLTSWGLQKILNSGNNTYSNVVNGSFINWTANLSMQSTSQLLTVPEVVNNATTFYRMVVTMPSSTNLILVGAEISYTYTVNN
jgi:hypothetical protein